MPKSRIKVKAMGLFVADGRMLLMDCFDSVKQKGFFRLLGGHIEFGEHAEEALRREMREELATDVEVLQRLDVIQNVFSFEGKDLHEIVFIHRARFLDESFNRRDDLRNIEPDKDEPFVWLPVSEALNGQVPLYPGADYRHFLSLIGADCGD
jgi:8-oxo-dGTP pyrophosphatase MutT (NUDIX family)